MNLSDSSRGLVQTWVKARARRYSRRKQMALRMFSTFKASDISFGEIRKNKSGGKTVYLNAAGGGKLIFQLPQLRAFVGLSPYKNDKGEIQSWSLPLSLDKPEVVAALQELDAKALDFIEANSEALMGKKMSRQVLVEGDKYKPIVKIGKKEGYAPTVNLKVLTNLDGSFSTEAYNSERTPVPLSDLAKGQTVSAIIDIGSVWASPLGCGVSIRVVQVMLAPTTKLKPCAFLPAADEPVVTADAPASDDGEVEYETDPEE